jgi:O-antigen/teichoic acid export membrane protein
MLLIVHVIEPGRKQADLSIPDTAIEAPQPPLLPNQEAQFRSQMGAISRHSSVFFAGTLFTAAAGYLFKIYVARKLGADALGVYALGMTIVGFVGVFNGLGLPQAATRFVAAYSATGQWQQLHAFLRRMSGVLLVANLVLALVVVLAGPWVAVHVYHLPALIPYLPLFAALLAIGGLTVFCGQILAGYKDIAIRTVVTNFIASPLNILLGVILLGAGFALRGYLISQVGTAAAVLVLLIAIARKMTPAQARRAAGEPVALEREVWLFSTAALGVSLLEFVLSQTDKVLLGVFLDVKEVGIYAIAAAMVVYVAVVLQSVNQIFSPTIADLHARGERALLGRLFQTLTKWVLGLTLPLALVLMIDAKPLMLLFGPTFGVGWAVLVVGTLGQLINAGVGSVGYMLLMSGNQARLIRVQAMMAVFVVISTVVLVRPFGMIGAAIAAAMTNALSNYLLLREVRTALRLWPYNRAYFRLIVPVAVSAAAAFGIKFLTAQFQPQWPWIGVTLIVSYVAFCGLALTSGLDDDDRMIVNAVRDRLRGAVGKSLSFS